MAIYDQFPSVDSGLHFPPELLAVLKNDIVPKPVSSNGFKDITSRIPVAVSSGTLEIAREGSTVWLDFRDLLITTPPTSSWHSWLGVIPEGYRVDKNWRYVGIPQIATSYSGGPIRLSTAGDMIVYRAKDGSGANLRITGMTSWITFETLPG